ncbi:penicillin-insensitive murein endopeptidase, partial [Mesorhizobium sp. M8A.F.Ca.ET.173.01.1.1]
MTLLSRPDRKPFLTAALALVTLAALAAGAISAEPRAKALFGARKLPAVAPAQSFGIYSKGCFTGGVALPMDGPGWEVMRPSRN